MALGVLGVVFLLSLKRCHSSAQHEGVATPASHDMDMQLALELENGLAHEDLVVLRPSVNVPKTFRSRLELIYDGYSALYNSLASNDVERLAAAATSMRKDVEATSAESLSEEAARSWVSHRRVLRTSLHQLSESATPGQRAQHFSHVTEAMYCSLASFGGIERDVRVYYCPTALGTGAYWLSDSRQARNPYPGKSMRNCAQARGTIPAATAPRTPESFRLRPSSHTR